MNSEIVISEGATTAAEAALMGKKTIYINSQIPNATRKLANLGLLEIAKSNKEVTEKINYMINLDKPEIDWNNINKQYKNPAKIVSDIILKLIRKI